MGETPKRIWLWKYDPDFEPFVAVPGELYPDWATEYIRADLAEAALIDGVKAGLEAAAEAAQEMADLYGPNGSESAIRALDPVAIARAAQKEGGE